MRARITLLVYSAVACGSAVGCRAPNPALDVPVRDEFVVPPDDPRYTQPPESGYRAPAVKKDWGSKPGMAGGPPSGGIGP